MCSKHFHLEELFDLGVVEGDGMIGRFVVLAVDCSAIDELAVDVDLAVRAVEAAYADLGVAGLLAARDGRQTRSRDCLLSALGRR